MRRALIVLSALILNASLLQRAWAAQACVWLVESVQDDGAHSFALNLSADAPISVAARYQGPGFTSLSMGGDMIQLDPGEPKNVDEEGFDVSAGDDLHFQVQLFDHALDMEQLHNPTGKPLATFTFDAKVGEDQHAPPSALAKQCQPLG